MITKSKHYDVLFIGATSPGGDLKQEGIKSFLSDTLGHTVHYFSCYQIDEKLIAGTFDFPSYDFVLWHLSSIEASGGSISKQILLHSIPTIVIDSEGFPISKSLSLVAPEATGSTLNFPGDYYGDSIYVAHVPGYGNAYHFLLSGQNMHRYTPPYPGEHDVMHGIHGGVGIVTGQPFNLHNRLRGNFHTVSLTADGQSEIPFTRPLLAAGHYEPGAQYGPTSPHPDEEEIFNIDLNNVALLVDDRRRIVASGWADWNYPYSPPHLFQPDLDSPYMVENNLYWDLLHQMVLFVTSVSPSFIPVGQNTFTETDLAVPSRGYDFSIQRTYASGIWNPNSYQSPSWTSNHDQYLIWDKFNERIQLFNGTGHAVEMEMVQGHPVVPPADEANPQPPGTRTFLSVNSGVTDIAIYFPPGNTDPLTLTNPSIEYPPPNFDNLGNQIPPPQTQMAREIFTGTRHPTHPEIENTTVDDHQSGFLIRDRHGNLAFFAHHPIREIDIRTQNPDPLAGPGGGVVGDQRARTRGGEFANYRIAYSQDANGNRVNYYYAAKKGGPWNNMPEDLLWCVVDTEGRGYHFDVQWIKSMKNQYHPWLSAIDTPGELPDIRYSYAQSDRYQVLTGPAIGHLLEEVEWKTESQSNFISLGKQKYGYWFAEDIDEVRQGSTGIGNDSPWKLTGPGRLLNTVFMAVNAVLMTVKTVLIMAIKFVLSLVSTQSIQAAFEAVQAIRLSETVLKDWEFNPPLKFCTDKMGRIVRQFEYTPPFINNYIIRIYKRSLWEHRSYAYFPGKLKKVVSGADADKTHAELYYHRKPGVGNRNDLTQIQDWVTSMDNGVASTVALNCRGHIIRQLQWYTSQAGLAAGSTPLVPPCDNWNPDDPGFDPFSSSSGWLWTFETNVDGQIIWEQSPSGIVKERHHLLDDVISHLMSQGNEYPLERRLTDFWQNYWHLRYWLSNEISVTTIGNDGTTGKHISTDFEPVFNRPSNEYVMDTLKLSLRYDYMEDGHSYLDNGVQQYGMPKQELFGLMHIPHAVNNEPWPDFLEADDIFNNIKWLCGDSESLCSRAGAPFSFDDEPNGGNVICKILPSTSGYGASTGRPQATALYGFDQYGRRIYFKSTDGLETLQQYNEGTSLPSGSSTNIYSERLIRSIDRDTGDETIKKQYYDERGLLVYALKSVDAGNDSWIYSAHEYNPWGRLLDTKNGQFSGRGETTDKHEEFRYDGNGNLLSTIRFRCPFQADPNCVSSNLAGDSVRQLRAYDTKGRMRIECQKISQETDTGIYTCTEHIYNQRNLLERKKIYSECRIPEGVQGSKDIAMAAMNAIDSGHLEFETINYYNALNLLEREISSGSISPSRETITLYDLDGRVTAIRNPEGVWRQKEYDAFGRLARDTQGLLDESLPPDDECVSSAYDYDMFDHIVNETRGFPIQGTWKTDAAFGETSSFYDERDTIVAKQVKQYPLHEPDNGSEDIWTYFSYNQNDQVLTETTVIEPSYKSSVEVSYDGLGRVKIREDSADHTSVEYERDDLDRILRETRHHYQQDNSSPHIITITEYKHNSAGKIIRRTEIDPLQQEKDRISEYHFDGIGYLMQRINPTGQTATYIRDGRGNPVEVHEHFLPTSESGYRLDGSWVTYRSLSSRAQYDFNGNVISRTDGQGQTTHYSLNDFGEIREITLPDGSGKQLTRNGLGAVTHIDYSDGRSLELQLDRFARTKNVFENQILSQYFEYFFNGKLKRAIDYNLANASVEQVVIDREWDTLSNLLLDKTSITEQGATIESTSNAEYEERRLRGMVLPSNTETKHIGIVYNEKHPKQIDAVMVEDETAVWYEWAGRYLLRRTVAKEGQNLITSRINGKQPTYDGFGQLASQNTYLGTGNVVNTTIHNFSYAYNGNGRLESEANVDDPDEQTTYELDDIGRVSEFSSAGTTSHYNHDEVNNIREIYDPVNQKHKTNFIIDRNGLNQIEAIEEAINVTNFKYDTRGNLVYDGEHIYDWDIHGRMVELKDSNGATLAQYSYDALHRRVRKSVLGENHEIIDFKLFDNDVVEEVRRNPGVPNEYRIFAIVHDPFHVDHYVRWDEYIDDGNNIQIENRRFPVADIRNNVVAVVNNNLEILRLAYDLFGNEVEKTSHTPYRFAGRSYDEETGLYYNRNRYYSAKLARFLSIDGKGIWGDSNNFGNGYCYVGNMTNALIDPRGEQSIRMQLKNFKYQIVHYMELNCFAPNLEPLPTTVEWGDVHRGSEGSIVAFLGDASVVKLNSGKTVIKLLEDQPVIFDDQEVELNAGTTITLDDDGNLIKIEPPEKPEKPPPPDPPEPPDKPDKGDSERTGGGDEGEAGITPQELLDRIRRALFSTTAKGSATPPPQLPPYWEDIIQTGSITDLIRRRTPGCPFDKMVRPVVYVDEWGNVIVESWRLNLTPMVPRIGGMQGMINFLLFVDPNRGGAIDPPPPIGSIGSPIP